jgi:hypothetical protein
MGNKPKRQRIKQMKTTRSILWAFVATVAFMMAMQVTPVFGQEAANPAPAQGKNEHKQETVETKDFKGKVFEIKNRDPRTLVDVITPLRSGSGGASISVSEEFRTITVRDYPENLASIGEAIARLDKPDLSPPVSTIEFHIHILIASNSPLEGPEPPSELSDVIKQLSSTLHYKNYGLMSSSLQRGREGGGNAVTSSGSADPKILGVTSNSATSPVFYDYSLERITLNGTGAESALQIGNVKFQMKFPVVLGTQVSYQTVGFSTPITIHNGEKLVVGTTTIGDKAVILVLIAHTGN